MTIIAPSLLAANFLNLKDDLLKINESKNIWLHIDIMDGHFVPNLSFGKPIIKNINKVFKHKLDAHFMVNNPKDHAEWFKSSNIYNFTYHYEIELDHINFIKKLKGIYPSVGISIKPETKVSEIPSEVLDLIDLILVMSVEPGFGGQSFMNESLDKIEKLKKIKDLKKYNYIIQVDGGVNDQTAKLAIQKGADCLVAGSYIFSKENMSDAIESLR